MKKRPAYGKIQIVKERHIRVACPVCGKTLPGFYRRGCFVSGLSLQCKRCHEKVKIEIDDRDQRPTASRVQ